MSPFAAVPLADKTTITINGQAVMVQCQPAPDSFARFGSLYRAEHRAGDLCCQSVDDPHDPQKKRNEIEFPPFLPNGAKEWMALSFMIEPGQTFTPPNTVLVLQDHLDVALGAKPPALCLHVRSVTGRPGEEIGFLDETGTHSAYVPFVRGHWYRAVMAFTNGFGEPTGSLEGWLDGVKLLDVSGVVTGYKGSGPSYAKAGMYQIDGDVACVVVIGNPEIAQAPGNLLSRI